jgi:DNA polymerase-3 subunit alpha/error-prone DNA polymerase
MKDFLDRVHPDKDEAKALVHAGALDGCHPRQNRTSCLWELAVWQHGKSGKNTTGSIFGDVAATSLPPLPPENERDRLRREFTVLGFLCDRHPMTLFSHVLEGRKTIKVIEIPRFLGKHVRVAAWIITGKVVHTKHGDLMEFLTFEDETGIIETTFFPDAYRKFCHMIDRQRPYFLTGKVEQNWGAITLTVEKVERVFKD